MNMQRGGFCSPFLFFSDTSSGLVSSETYFKSKLFSRLYIYGSVLLAPQLSVASDYGVTGLIDMPTARMQDDGSFRTTVALDGRNRQYAITYQVTPWLEGTFRYTGWNDQAVYTWDRNYEFKARLLREDSYLPAVAVGVRDLFGTGVFGSEYAVATKRIGNTDISLGLGWGRLSGSGDIANPLKWVSSRFDLRNADTGLGGKLSLGDFFSGPQIGVFGGVKHRFQTLPLSLIAEYNPDRYEFDISRGGLGPKSPVSMGVAWDALPNVSVTASYQHAEEIGLAVHFSLNSFEERPRRTPDNFISSYYLSQSDLPSQINKNKWYDRLLYDVERSGLILVEGAVSEDLEQAKLVVGNASYDLWSDALARLTALADLHLPATVRSIHFIVEDAGHRAITVVVARPSSSMHIGGAREYLRSVRLLSGRTLDQPQYRTGFATGKISNSIHLRTRFQLFDPDDPARYQVYADLSSEYTLNAHWAIRSTLSLNVDQNFDQSKRQESDSVLPKVRSDIVRYLNEGESGIDKLIIEGRDTYGRSLHYRGFAGILEEMYSGVGGEVLFWPTQSRLALGASFAVAQQRDYARRLGHLDYRVNTAHLSAYWATPFLNYDLAIHAGRYLAKDNGA